MENKQIIRIKEDNLNGAPKVDKKIVKYFRARKEGKNKTTSALEAGYADANHTTRLEKSRAYENLDRYYREVLLNEISLKEIALLNIRNAKQERDLGASNMAIKLALERIDSIYANNEENEEVIIVLKN